MKTIYLFAVISDTTLKSKRASENPTPKDGETHISTLFEQPDNYWELFTKHGDGTVAIDPPLNPA